MKIKQAVYDKRTNNEKKGEKYIFAVIFIGLLILRFPLLIIPQFTILSISSDNLFLIYINGTYFLTAVLIFLERNKLSQFKINIFAITIFLLTPILKPIVYFFAKVHIPFNSLFFIWFNIIVSVLLCLSLVISHTKIHIDKFKYHIKWFILSVFIGVITAIVLSLIYSRNETSSEYKASIITYLVCVVTQMSHAAIMEEPLFRGFLWGCLEKKGLNLIWICFFQAAFFCIGHVYYLPLYPVNFIATFVVALILGYLVWKSKSIGTSIIAHGIINSLVDLIVHYKW